MHAGVIRARRRTKFARALWQHARPVRFPSAAGGFIAVRRARLAHQLGVAPGRERRVAGGSLVAAGGESIQPEAPGKFLKIRRLAARSTQLADKSPHAVCNLASLLHVPCGC